MRLVRRAPERERDAVRGVRTEAESAGTSVLSRFALALLATPPHFHRPLLDWVLVGVALVLPWVWVVALERRLQARR